METAAGLREEQRGMSVAGAERVGRRVVSQNLERPDQQGPSHALLRTMRRRF